MLKIILMVSLCLFAFQVNAQPTRLQTEVFAEKTPGDVELVIDIRESGNSQSETFRTEANVDVGGNLPGMGEKIASTVFSGPATTMSIRVIEDDGPDSNDDGVCNVSVTVSAFTMDPIILKCVREENNGLEITYIINIVVKRI